MQRLYQEMFMKRSVIFKYFFFIYNIYIQSNGLIFVAVITTFRSSTLFSCLLTRATLSGGGQWVQRTKCIDNNPNVNNNVNIIWSQKLRQK